MAKPKIFTKRRVIALTDELDKNLTQIAKQRKLPPAVLARELVDYQLKLILRRQRRKNNGSNPNK